MIELRRLICLRVPLVLRRLLMVMVQVDLLIMVLLDIRIHSPPMEAPRPLIAFFKESNLVWPPFPLNNPPWVCRCNLRCVNLIIIWVPLRATPHNPNPNTIMDLPPTWLPNLPLVLGTLVRTIYSP